MADYNFAQRPPASSRPVFWRWTFRLPFVCGHAPEALHTPLDYFVCWCPFAEDTKPFHVVFTALCFCATPSLGCGFWRSNRPWFFGVADWLDVWLQSLDRSQPVFHPLVADLGWIWNSTRSGKRWSIVTLNQSTSLAIHRKSRYEKFWWGYTLRTAAILASRHRCKRYQTVNHLHL